MTYSDIYLPSNLFATIENKLARTQHGLVAPLVTIEELNEQLEYGRLASPIALCIDSLTRDFPDGRTYFVISKATVATAMVMRFPNFQCVILSYAISKNILSLTASLLGQETLRDCLLFEREIEDPDTETVATRRDAVKSLVDKEESWIGPNVDLFLKVHFAAVYFLTAHEIGHLALDHIDNINGIGHLDEHDYIEDRDRLFHCRCLEWQADCFAIIATIFMLRMQIRNERQNWDTLLGTEESWAAIRLTAFVAYLLFSIMDIAHLEDKNPDMSTHPSALTRYSLSAMQLAVFLKIYDERDMGETFAHMKSAIKGFEIVLCQLAGGMMTSEEVDRFGGEAEQNLLKMLEHLTELSPKQNFERIENYSWGGIFSSINITS